MNDIALGELRSMAYTKLNLVASPITNNEVACSTAFQVIEIRAGLEYTRIYVSMNDLMNSLCV